MSRFPGSDPRDEPSLDAIRSSDDFINALAAGQPATPSDTADADLAALLGGWRDEMRFPPAAGLISESDAIAALNAGLAQKPTKVNRDVRQIRSASPNRSRRGLTVIGAAAAAVMCIGGFGAVVAGAGPGDALYGLRTMIFGAPKQVRDDQVALAARTELNQVQDLIARGDWVQAQDKLVAVSSQVETIGDGQQKQELMEQFNDLSAKVVERDPEATAPPGITYTVPPSATELVPAVAPPTSTPTAPSLTDSATTTPESASSSTSVTSSTSITSTSASPTTSATPTTTATSATPTTTATSAAPTTTAAPTTSAAPTTTAAPTTAAPTTAAATTTAAPTTAASATASAPPAATTSVATKSSTPAQATAATTTVAPAQAVTTTTQVPQTAVAQTTVAQTTAAATTTAEAPKAPAPVTTTTVVIPLPVPAG